MVAESSRILSEFSTAPSMGTALWASSISGVFVAMMATVSPGETPRPAKAEAKRQLRR